MIQTIMTQSILVPVGDERLRAARAHDVDAAASGASEARPSTVSCSPSACRIDVSGQPKFGPIQLRRMAVSRGGAITCTETNAIL